jgi:hypothetical protein
MSKEHMKNTLKYGAHTARQLELLDKCIPHWRRNYPHWRRNYSTVAAAWKYLQLEEKNGGLDSHRLQTHFTPKD